MEGEHRLSPSSWNRFETCPRMHWLSRQGLPRKTGMAAALGTAVHASIEDLLNLDLADRPRASMGWLPEEGERLLRDRWTEEKAAFHATPRHPRWKEERWSEALDGQRGGIDLLLRWVGVQGLEHDRVTVALWSRVQERVLVVEGEVISRDGRLGGRVDLLLEEVADDGTTTAWVVADLKTGRAPEGDLKPEVDRQLRFYRDILMANNPDAPAVRAEGWYTVDRTTWVASKDGVLEDAYLAWEATIPSEAPAEATPGESSCGGFCDWKAWCPHWLRWRQDEGRLDDGEFRDAVVRVVARPKGSSTVQAERQVFDAEGRLGDGGGRLSVTFTGSSIDRLDALMEQDAAGPIFLGSALARGTDWRIGHWCDVLAWSPIPDA